jgi:hypothetical protein
MLEQVSPKIAFFIKQVIGTELGRKRVVKSIRVDQEINDPKAGILMIKF